MVRSSDGCCNLYSRKDSNDPYVDDLNSEAVGCVAVVRFVKSSSSLCLIVD